MDNGSRYLVPGPPASRRAKKLPPDRKSSRGLPARRCLQEAHGRKATTNHYISCDRRNSINHRLVTRSTVQLDNLSHQPLTGPNILHTQRVRTTARHKTMQQASRLRGRGRPCGRNELARLDKDLISAFQVADCVLQKLQECRLRHGHRIEVLS